LIPLCSRFDSSTFTSGLHSLDREFNFSRSPKVAENAGWDRERLAIELPDLAKLLAEDNLDISLTGFSPAEIDQLQIDFEEDPADPDDEIDQGWQKGPLVSQRGSLWVLDQHRLLCGDARSESDLNRLMEPSQARAIADRLG
jgi:hypothetical protein